MSEFIIFVDYENAKGDRNYYKVNDTAQSMDNVTFTWLLESDVTACQGTVVFAIRMVKRDGTKIIKQFDTDKAMGTVLDGMNVFQRVPLSDQKDILGKIENDAVENIQENLNNYTVQKKTELNTYTDEKKNTINEFTDEKKKEISDLTEISKTEIEKTKDDAVNGLSWKEPVDKNTAAISLLKEDLGYDEKQLLSKTSNLLDWKNVEIFNGYNDGSKLVASSNNDFHTIILPISVSYKTSFFVTRFGQLSSRFSVAKLRGDAINGAVTYGTQQNNTAKSIQISATPEDDYLAIWFAGSSDVDWKTYLKNIVVINGIFAPENYIEPVENNVINKVNVVYEANELKRTTNLFDCNNPMLFYGMNTGNALSYGNQCCILIPVNESSLKAYTVSRFGEKGKYFSVATLHDEPGDGVTTYNTVQDNTAESIQIYVRPEDKYIVIWFYTNSDTVKMKDIMDGIVVLRRYIPATGFIPYLKKNNPLFEKKINFLGDSFTDDAISYEYQLTDRLCLDNVHVGKGNSAIVTDTSSADSFLTRMSALDENADITIIFGGINDARDIGNGSIILGEIDSAHDKTSFYGGMQLLLDNIITKTPAQFILGVIPPSFQPNKPYTTWIPQIQKAEREIYNKYHIPFVDLDKDCFAMSDNPTIMTLYRKSVTGTTNYHPNSAGAKKIADCVQGELEKYIH